MKIRESIEEEYVKRLHEKLDQVLDSEGGFIIMADTKNMVDYYQNVTVEQVIGRVSDSVIEYEHVHGILNTTTQKISVACRHLQEDPTLDYYRDDRKPDFPDDSGHTLACVKGEDKKEHDFENADHWTLLHESHLTGKRIEEKNETS